MVIVKNPKRGTIGPSMKGLFYAYEKNGEFQVKTWPPKRGKPRSEAQAQTQELFKQACEAMKRMPAEFLNYAREQAKGTPMLPRDYLMAALYGNMQTLKLQNGERRYSMATRVNLSVLMDNIGDQEGMLLLRGTDDLWVGLPIGEVGQVLSVDEDLMPSWQFSEGGGGSTWRHAIPGSDSGKSFNTKGVWFQPLLDGSIDRVAFTHSFLSTDVVSLGIYRFTGNFVGTVQEVLLKQVFTGTQDGNQHHAIMELDTPIDLIGGDKCMVAFSIIGASSTYVNRIHVATGFDQGWPSANDGGYGDLASDVPIVGSDFTCNTGTSYAIYISASF